MDIPVNCRPHLFVQNLCNFMWYFRYSFIVFFYQFMKYYVTKTIHAYLIYLALVDEFITFKLTLDNLKICVLLAITANYF